MFGHAAPAPPPPGVIALPYTTGFLVTGDYAVGSVDLVSSNTGTISMPNVVPANADILAAFLYWETITSSTISDRDAIVGAKFRGLDLAPATPTAQNPGARVKAIGSNLTGNTSACYASNGTGTLKLRMYRADVLAMLEPQRTSYPNGTPTGKLLVNDADLIAAGKPLTTVTLPEAVNGNQIPQSAGATLVVVYRDVRPNIPLRKIVAYDGVHVALPGETTSQTLQGFYRSAGTKSAKLTHMVGSGANNDSDFLYFNGTLIAKDVFPGTSKSSDRAWSSRTFDVSSLMSADTTDSTFGETAVSTVTHGKISPYECLAWAGTWFSTTVADIDNDGIPDGLEDLSLPYQDPPAVNPSTGAAVPRLLPDLKAMGAGSDHRDIFIEINAMKTGATSYGSAGHVYKWKWNDLTSQVDVLATTLQDSSGHNHLPTPDVLKMVGDAYKNAPTSIRAHFDVGDNDAYHAYAAGVVDPKLVNAADDYLVKTLDPAGNKLARGGEQITETNWTSTLFPGWPGTIGWGFGIEHAMFAAVGPNGEELTNSTTPTLTEAENACQTGIAPPSLPSYQCRRRFDESRDEIFHYVLYAHARGKRKSSLACLDTNGVPTAGDANNQCAAPNVQNPDFTVPSSASGVADLPGNKSLVTLGLFAQPQVLPADPLPNFVATPIVNASTLLHELGHTLWLYHGGFQGEPNCKPNYLSSMSYLFQLNGLIDPNSATGLPQPDYSRETNNSLDELSLSDPFVAGRKYQTAWYAPWVPPSANDPNYPNGSFGYLNGAISTNPRKFCNGVLFGSPKPQPLMARVDGAGLTSPLWNGSVAVTSQDVNFDSFLDNPSNGTKLQGFNDWSQVLKTGLNQVGSGRVAGLISIGGSDFGGSDFGGSDFGGSDFGGSDFGGSDFGGSDFGGSDFGGSDFGGIGFEGSDFGGSDFGGSDFGGSDFGGAELDYETAAALGFTPPTGLKAAVITNTSDPNFHRVNLTWNQPAFGVVTLYHVTRFWVVNGVPTAPTEVGGGSTPTADQCASPGQLCKFTDTTELPNNQSFVYIVKADFNDGSKSGASNTSNTITAVNDPPVAVADSFTTIEDTVVTGNVLANDTDDDSNHAGLRAMIVSLPASGTLAKADGTPLAINDVFDGAFKYTPPKDIENATFTFTYRATDGNWSLDPSVSMSDPSAQTTATLGPAAGILSRHTTTTVASTLSSPVYGDMITFTATVSPDTNPVPGIPTGTIQFLDGGNLIGTGPLVAGAASTASATFSTATLNAGTHSITAVYCGSATKFCDTNFYGSTSTAFSQMVNPKPLTVTAVNQAKTYDGNVFSPFTATLTGFVLGETEAALRTSGALTGTPTFTGPATTAINAGSYTITPTAGSLVAANYVFTVLVNGTLTINKAPLTVTADNKSKTYDGAVYSPFTATLSGFVNNESDAGLRTAGALSGAAMFTGTATTAVNVGSYVITPAVGSLTATNYNFTAFVNGTLTIVPAPSITTFGAAPTPTFGGGNFAVSASNNSAGVITYAYASGPCAVVDGNAGTFSSSGVGSCVVQANTAATQNYLASFAQQTVNIRMASGLLFAATDADDFNNTASQLSITNVSGSSVVQQNGLATLAFPLNGMASAGSFMYGGDPFTNALQKFGFDGAPLSSPTTITGGVQGPYNEDYAFDGTFLYRAHYPDRIEKIDPSNATVIATYLANWTSSSAQGEPVGITLVGNQFWVSRWHSPDDTKQIQGDVGTWDPVTNTYTHQFYTPSLAGGLAYDAINGILWVGRLGGCVEPHAAVAPYPVLGSGGDSSCEGGGFRPFGDTGGDTIDGLEFVATPLTFGGLQIASTNFSMTGAPVVALSGSVINQTAGDNQNVVVQSYITQSGKSVGAGGAVLTGSGQSQPGSISAFSTVVLGSIHSANAGLTSQAGMVQGAAVLVVELIQGDGTVADRRTFAITLTP